MNCWRDGVELTDGSECCQAVGNWGEHQPSEKCDCPFHNLPDAADSEKELQRRIAVLRANTIEARIEAARAAEAEACAKIVDGLPGRVWYEIAAAIRKERLKCPTKS